MFKWKEAMIDENNYFLQIFKIVKNNMDIYLLVNILLISA